MRLRKEVEDGYVKLDPYPTGIYDYTGAYERVELVHKKRGVHLEIVKFDRGEGIGPEYTVTGDIPVKTDKHERAVNEMNRVTHCKVEYIHKHPESGYMDLHPVCTFWNELQLREDVSRLWDVAMEFTEEKRSNEFTVKDGELVEA